MTIDLDDIPSAIARIVSEPDLLARISTAGRQWAIKNYAPVPTAIRFLQTLEGSCDRGQSAIAPVESIADSPTLKLSEINLIVFPNWSAPEETLCLELAKAIQAVATHLDKTRITLLIDTSNVSDEEANLVISSITMELLLEQELDVSEGPEICLIGDLKEYEWAALLRRVRARIVLEVEAENKQAIAQAKAENLPLWS